MKYLTKWTDGSKIYSSTLSGTPLATSTKYDRCEISLNSDGLIVPSTNSIYWGGQEITALEIYSVDDVQLEKISSEFPPQRASLVTKTGRVVFYTKFKNAGASPYTYAENYPEYRIYTGDEFTDTQNFDTRIPMSLTALNGLVFDIDGDIAMNVKVIGGRAHHYLLSASDPDVAPQKAICWTSSVTGKLDSGTYGNQILEYLGEGYAVTSIPNIYNLEVGEEEDPPTGPYAPGGTSSPGGGGGSFGSGEESDDISTGIPSGTVEGAYSGAGLFTHYLVDYNLMQIIGDWLWADNLGLAIAKEFISAIYGSPSESLISLLSYPFVITPSMVTTTSKELYWGGHGAGFNVPVLNSQGITIDWGTITLSEYWGNFLDYTPHTKIELYLPWGTGFVSIDPGQVLPGTISVKTNIELSKGSCIHNIIGSNGSVIGTYSGQVAKQLPMTSLDTAGKVTGMITAAVAPMVAGAIGTAGALAKGASTAASFSDVPRWVEQPLTGKMVRTNKPTGGDLLNMMSQQAVKNYRSLGKAAGNIATTSLAVNRTPAHVTRNGGFTDGSASLSVQYPYIILSRPTQSVPKEYGHYYGYPSNIYTELRSLVGYTEIGEIHLNGIPALAEELGELDRLLKEGAIF